MELLARGVKYPYKSNEELLAIEQVKNNFHLEFFKSMAPISRLTEQSVSSIMENIENIIFPDSKYKKAEKIKRFQQSFEKIRSMGNIKIVNW